MKKTRFYFRYVLVLLLTIGFIACSSSDDDPDPGEGADFRIESCKILTVDAGVTNGNASFEWAVTKSVSGKYSLTNTTAKEVMFAAVDPGEYELSVTLNSTDTKKFKVYVSDESKAYKTYINKVYDFKPAPGQFINDLPPAVVGDSYENVLRRTNTYLAKEKGDLISLGGFGGYVVFGFDHTIVNVKGKRDFRVLGNAFWADANPNPDAPLRGGSSEAGVIMVAYDVNKNGVPDDDEWYEIKGAAHDMAKTVLNYELIYHWPDPNKTPVPGGGTGTVLFTDVEYIKWIDNQEKTDYMWQNNAYNHSIDYWPRWQNNEKTLTFKGTRLPDNAVDESGTGTYYVQYAFAYGYADNAPNNDNESAMDIDWAMDKNGKRVHLPGIDFVKVYNGLNQQCGWLGETSTEIMGATDLHLRGEDIPTREIWNK
ncbi:MAG: hypothetical protein LBL79_01470 [Prevotella sp.]|jgi:hypothetical protein|nr:hypothetical protein [Prevotella sp.]